MVYSVFVFAKRRLVCMKIPVSRSASHASLQGSFTSGIDLPAGLFAAFSGASGFAWTKLPANQLLAAYR
jgi:hypothetical protein